MPQQMSPTRSERADQVVVEAGEGAELVLSLVRADGSQLSLMLGTGEVVALAADLLAAARLRTWR
jgi:hypothetical protein